MLRRVGEPVVGLAQLVRHQPADHGVERAQRHEQNQQAAYSFQGAVDALDEYGKLEQPVQTPAAFRLLHAAGRRDTGVFWRRLLAALTCPASDGVNQWRSTLIRNLRLVCGRVSFASADVTMSMPRRFHQGCESLHASRLIAARTCSLRS